METLELSIISDELASQIMSTNNLRERENYVLVWSQYI